MAAAARSGVRVRRHSGKGESFVSYYDTFYLFVGKPTHLFALAAKLRLYYYVYIKSCLRMAPSCLESKASHLAICEELVQFPVLFVVRERHSVFAWPCSSLSCVGNR